MPRSRGRGTGTTTKLAVLALVTILAVAAVLELRGGEGGERQFLEHAAASLVAPLDLVTTAARANRLVLLADIAGSGTVKRFAAEVIDTLARTSGLDAVALDIDADQQPWIDRYLLSRPEDPSILLQRPSTLHDAEGTGRDYLEIYRAVWRLNDELGADRAIRIIALDPPAWSSALSASPSGAARLYGQRDGFMAERIDERLLERNARARILFFVGGLHALRGTAQVQTGGTSPVPVVPLAERLARSYPNDVYSILVDAPLARTPPTVVAKYRGTTYEEAIRRRLIARPSRFALRIGEPFAYENDPIRFFAKPGIEFSLVPRNQPLHERADAYVYIEN